MRPVTKIRLKIANSDAGSAEQTIRIEGGLPALPGTQVIMPKHNGHELELEAEPVLPAPPKANGSADAHEPPASPADPQPSSEAPPERTA